MSEQEGIIFSEPQLQQFVETERVEAVDPTAPVLEPQERRPLLRGLSVLTVLFALVLGVVLGAVGTANHRSFLWGLPIGLLISLVFLLSAALGLRAWRGLMALVPFGIAWVITVESLSLFGPGGDVLVVDPRAPVEWAGAGTVWTYLGTALLVLVMFLPRRWFVETSSRLGSRRFSRVAAADGDEVG